MYCAVLYGTAQYCTVRGVQSCTVLYYMWLCSTGQLVRYGSWSKRPAPDTLSFVHTLSLTCSGALSLYFHSLSQSLAILYLYFLGLSPSILSSPLLSSNLLEEEEEEGGGGQEEEEEEKEKEEEEEKEEEGAPLHSFAS